MSLRHGSRLRSLLKPTAHNCVLGRRYDSSSSHYYLNPYDKTISNLDIGVDTRVIFQGFTGKAATANAKDTIAYGTNIVGGVSPLKPGIPDSPSGRVHLDLPVFGTVREAKTHVAPTATVVFVPARAAASAIIDAVEAEIPLIVSVAEHVPLHDMLRVHEVLQTQDRSRLVGPNCPGIINPRARVRMGIMPYKVYQDGCVGIVSKSGTLSYEAVASTSQAGLGQSLVVGMGGDVLPGTTFADALSLFFTQPHTKGIILIGEIGGEAELRAAELIRNYHAKTPLAQQKPIVAMIAGRTAPLKKVMGHAGAIMQGEDDVPAAVKVQALEEAGCTIVLHPSLMGEVMQDLLRERGCI